ncbi:MAG: hypothetical protein HY290_01760 [Planctomycetia bacterium]|nr:hypothetical protein [Planctomycetia bacterium]
MTATKPAPRADVLVPHDTPAENRFNSNDSQHLAILRELTASWHPVTTVVNRRPGHRARCNYRAELVPLDDASCLPAAAAMEVQVTDLSRNGIGIMHLHAMPHRLVLVSYQTEAGRLARVVVRLKWCRFKRAEYYQSGGQIVRVLPADQDAQS